jgi:hypothetical protein
MIELFTYDCIGDLYDWWVNFYRSISDDHHMSTNDYVSKRDRILLSEYGATFNQDKNKCVLRFETEEQKLLFLLKWSSRDHGYG